jgi:large subunit ribosomal protein L24
MLVCPKCSKPAKTGIRVLDDGTRSRFCKKCNELIDS